MEAQGEHAPDFLLSIFHHTFQDALRAFWEEIPSNTLQPHLKAFLQNLSFSFNSRSGIEGLGIKKQSKCPLPVITSEIRKHWSMG